MNWFRRAMSGRYGTDQLNFFLLFLSILIILIGQLTNLLWLAVIGYLPFVFSIYRMFSKNIQKRSMENYKFSMLFSPLYTRILKNINIIKDKKTHRYYKCPECKAKLRVPKGKGKIAITCPMCSKSFIKKT